MEWGSGTDYNLSLLVSISIIASMFGDRNNGDEASEGGGGTGDRPTYPVSVPGVVCVSRWARRRVA